MMSPNALLIEQVKLVHVVGPIAPSTTTPDFVSMKGCACAAIVISTRNTTTVTGSAISITQATDVSNTSGKTLAFSTAYRALNTGAGGNTDLLSSFTVSSNTFTTDATNSTENLYVIEITEADLDVANNFDCFRLNTGNSTNATVSGVVYLFPAKYGKTQIASAIAD
jgi:hypothetical protein